MKNKINNKLELFFKERILIKYKKIFTKKEYDIINKNQNLFKRIYLLGIVDGYDSKR